jgi:hypothetical protein
MGSRTGSGAKETTLGDGGVVPTLGDGESRNTRRRGVAGGTWEAGAGVLCDDAAGGGDVQVGAKVGAGVSTLGGSWVVNGEQPWVTRRVGAGTEGPINRHFSKRSQRLAMASSWEMVVGIGTF